MSERNKILLSFDIEEFDVPREHGVEIALDEQIRISEQGTKLRRHSSQQPISLSIRPN